MKVKAKNPADAKLVNEAASIARKFKMVRCDGPAAKRMTSRYQSIVDRLGYDPIS